MARKAFTLIELTLVTVIILALIGLSLPLFKKTFTNLSAKDAAFNISKIASYAQEKAVIDRRNYRAIFDFNRRQYQIFEFDKPVKDKDPYKKVAGRFGRVFTLPRGLFFYDPKTGMSSKAEEEYRKQVIFYPDGRCTELSINIADNKGNGYSITLKGFGTLPKIKEVIGEEM
ncbi:MAG: hypothetical protein PHX20_01685 [Candidatus Omnitrophica bacterium]|nr:hypothetical protein [Candidatus Omnitrophota bacterium]MDD5436234.1 hypothetical protein [Candidatus Omnitrophota bacterium]